MQVTSEDYSKSPDPKLYYHEHSIHKAKQREGQKDKSTPPRDLRLVKRVRVCVEALTGLTRPHCHGALVPPMEYGRPAGYNYIWTQRVSLLLNLRYLE